jgi:hypothetical protein
MELSREPGGLPNLDLLKVFLDRPIVGFLALAVVAVAANMVLLVLWLRGIRKEPIQVATASPDTPNVPTANRKSPNKPASAEGMSAQRQSEPQKKPAQQCDQESQSVASTPPHPWSPSGLSKASDTQVKDCALALVARIRKELWELDREDSRLFAQQRANAAAAVTQGQKQNIWDQYVSQQRHYYTAFLETFTETYHVDAISLRNEILRRLPVVEVSVNKTCESPIDTMGVEEAVRELERLARLL